MRSFLELDEQEFAGAIVILDVDGTLVSDRGQELSYEVEAKIRAFGSCTRVELCSNALPERTRLFAETCEVGVIDTPHRKPSRRVAESILGKEPLVVIGDKALTDGLFAANIGANFIQVQRVRGEGESALAKVSYVLDGMVSPFLRFMRPVLPHLVLLRPRQWVKNVLVIAPVFFAGTAFNLELLGKSILAAAVFSLIASAMYVLNDMKDRAQDSLHPTKRFRPLASGAVSESEGYALLALLLVIACAGSVAIPGIIVPALAYVAVNVLYSLYLKNIPVIDLLSVSVSYVLRVVAGGAATLTLVSPWIVLCVFFGAFFMITAKRLAEFGRASRRKVLSFYSESALTALLILSALLAVVSYGAYALLGGHSNLILFSVPLVAIAIARAAYRIFTSREDAEYPETLVFKDAWILGTTALWVVFMFFVLY